MTRTKMEKFLRKKLKLCLIKTLILSGNTLETTRTIYQRKNTRRLLAGNIFISILVTLSIKQKKLEKKSKNKSLKRKRKQLSLRLKKTSKKNL